MLEELTENFQGVNDKFIYEDFEKHSYDELYQLIQKYNSFLSSNSINNSVVFFNERMSINSIALLISLFLNKNIVVPLVLDDIEKIEEYKETSESEIFIQINEGELSFKLLKGKNSHPHIQYLKNNDKPGLILFSSGTTGKSKAIIHDFELLFKKHETKRKDLSTLVFMHFDHIGGIDTLFYCLSNISSVTIPTNRTPNHVSKLIENNKIEVLPTTPSFLNLMIIGNNFEKYDLSSLKYVTYGTEKMPQSTLNNVTKKLKNVRFLQKYGTSEVGTLRSSSEANDSLWVKLGGEGYGIRVVDGILQIKARSSMLGYLNAEDPFTHDGWFITGDKVEQKGEFLKFLGRESKIINVGGEKVYPEEVEDVLMQMDEIIDVIVYGKGNPLLGNIVACDLVLSKDLNLSEVKRKVREFTKDKLEQYKIPIKYRIVEEIEKSRSFKKERHR